MQNTQALTLSEAVETFLLAGDADGLSDKTVAWYRSLLGKFVELYGARLLLSITVNEIRAYVSALRKIYASETVSCHTRALHRFWKWSVQEFKIENPMTNIAYPKAPESQSPESFSHAEIVSLLRVAGEGPNGVRDKAIIAFMFDTGVRAAGLVNLKWADMNLEQGWARVREKRLDERNVYFTEWAAEFIYQWRAVAEHQGKYVFYSLRQDGKGDALTTNGLYQLFKRLKERMHTDERVYPHKMRHTTARHWQGSITSLRQQLGHSSAKTTMDFYGRFLDTDLAKMYEDLAPSGILKRPKMK